MRSSMIRIVTDVGERSREGHVIVRAADAG